MYIIGVACTCILVVTVKQVIGNRICWETKQNIKESTVDFRLVVQNTILNSI